MSYSFSRRSIVVLLLVVIHASFVHSIAQSQDRPQGPQKPVQSKQKVTPKQAQAETGEVETLVQKVNNLLQLAKGASPEIRADTLLTLEASKLVTDAAKKMELLEEVFLVASEVREPLRRNSTSRVVDTHSGYMQYAFDLELDKLSLQSQVVIRMASLNPGRARELFDQISLPSFKPISCQDSLVYNADSYYDAVQVVFDKSFSAEQRQFGNDIQFLVDRIDRVNSFAQAAGVARILARAKLATEPLLMLVEGFARALKRLEPDPRSFAYARGRGLLVGDLAQLLWRLKNQDTPSSRLLHATHKFLLSNLSGDVCGDAYWIEGTETHLPGIILSMNRVLPTPLTIDDIRSAKVKESGADVEYWTTKEGKALLAGAKSLRFGDGEKTLSLQERQTEAWHQELIGFLELLESWKAESEASEEDYFFQRCNMYLVLVDVCPNDTQRDVVLRSYSNYLKEASNKYKGRIEWIIKVKEYLRRLRDKSPETRRSSLAHWFNSSDTGLRIYAELEQLMAARN